MNFESFQRWGTLFTCLDVCNVLTVHVNYSCLLAIRSLICQRGQLGALYTDIEVSIFKKLIEESHKSFNKSCAFFCTNSLKVVLFILS